MHATDALTAGGLDPLTLATLTYLLGCALSAVAALGWSAIRRSFGSEAS